MYIGFMWQRKSFVHVNDRPYPLRDARILGSVMVSCHQNPDQQQGINKDSLQLSRDEILILHVR